MDIYDEQIARLRNKSKYAILDEWVQAKGMFKMVGDGRHQEGCITLIKLGKYYAYTHGVVNDKLTEAIRNDDRLPKYGTDITHDHLPVFAEWHRIIDLLTA